MAQLTAKRAKVCLNVGFQLTKVLNNAKEITNSSMFTTSIKQLLSSRDDLVSTVQFNYMIDADWLLDQYRPCDRNKPLTLVVGGREHVAGAMHELMANVDVIKAPNLTQYGTHHTKMMLLFFARGMKVVVHTANLIENDWCDKTQGVWVSPFLQKRQRTSSVSSSSAAVSAAPSQPAASHATSCQSAFLADMMQYLQAYGNVRGKSASMKNIRDTVAQHDFSPIKRTRLVASAPGYHREASKALFGHVALRRLLTSEAVRPYDTVVAQFSSIGSLGGHGMTPKSWLGGEFSDSLKARAADAAVKVVYPCMCDVRDSNEGWGAGNSIPHSMRYEKQHAFLQEEGIVHKWRAEWSGRSKCMPHIKTFAGWSGGELSWLLLGSHNLSKAAWGQLQKKESQLHIRSYELGVLMLSSDDNRLKPLSLKYSLRGASHDDTGCTWLPVPYDYPLTSYAQSDSIWFWDHPYPGETDVHDNTRTQSIS